MNKKKGCKATQQNDQMICGACGLAWDVNDSDRPSCRPIKQSSWHVQDRKRGLEVLARLKEGLK